MCFSAGASFAASGGLAILGADSVRITPKRLRLLAVIPLLFAVQQAIEGIQWLYIGAGTTCPAAGYGFLAFAYLLWPLYIPAMVYLLDKSSRPMTRWCIMLGGFVAVGGLGMMLSSPLAIYLSANHHVVYDLHIPNVNEYVALYALAVCGALFASRVTAFRLGGIVVLLSAIAANYISWFAFASVWCFMAAVISSSIWLYLRRKRTAI